jgi:hypothetical protein
MRPKFFDDFAVRMGRAERTGAGPAGAGRGGRFVDVFNATILESTV